MWKPGFYHVTCRDWGCEPWIRFLMCDRCIWLHSQHKSNRTTDIINRHQADGGVGQLDKGWISNVRSTSTMVEGHFPDVETSSAWWTKRWQPNVRRADTGLTSLGYQRMHLFEWKNPAASISQDDPVYVICLMRLKGHAYNKSRLTQHFSSDFDDVYRSEKWEIRRQSVAW